MRLFWLLALWLLAGGPGLAQEAQVLCHLDAEALQRLGLQEGVTGLHLTPDGSRLLLAQELGEARCRLVALDSRTGALSASHTFEAVEVAAFAPARTGHHAVLLLDFGRRAALLDVESGKLEVFYSGDTEFRFKAPVWVLADARERLRFWTQGYFKEASGGKRDPGLYAFDLSRPGPFSPQFELGLPEPLAGLALAPERSGGILVTPGESPQAPLRMSRFPSGELVAEAFVFAPPALFNSGIAYLAQDESEVHRLFLHLPGEPPRLLGEEARARFTPPVASPSGDRILCSRLRWNQPQQFLLVRDGGDLEPLGVPGWTSDQVGYYELSDDGRTFALVAGDELLVGRLP